MSIISSCPKCSQSVLLPVGLSASATVRCPLCQEQYSLQEVLGQLPPMLEVIDAGQPAIATAFAAPAVESHDDDLLLASSSAFAESAPLAEPTAFGESTGFDASTPFAEPEDASTPYAKPAPGDSENDFGFTPASDELAESDLDPDEVDTVLDEERRPTITYGERLTGFDHGHDGSGFEPIPTGFGSPAGQLNGVNTYRAASTALDEEEIELDTEPAAEFEEAPAEESPFDSIAVKPGPRKRRREPSVIGNLIGVVGGGVVGLGLGYMILLWIGGPEKDFFGYSKNIPRWMLPSSFAEKDAEEAEPSGFATSFDQVPPQVAQNDSATTNPNPGPRQPKPPAGPDLGELPLNVPSLPNEPATPSEPKQTTRNKPALDGPLEIEPTTPAPSLDLPAPDLAPPLISPPGMTPPKPKTPAGDNLNLPVDPLKPEPELTIPPVEPAKPEMKPELKPETPATETPKPEPAVVTDTPKPEPTPPKTDDVPPPVESIGLKVPPTFTTEELAMAVQEAKDAQTKADEATAAGAADARALTGAFFKKAYYVAEILTFLPKNPDDAKLVEARDSAQQLALSLASDPAKKTLFNLGAGRWYSARPVKGDHDGLIFAGVVQSTGKSGKMFETKLLLNDSDKVITILGDSDPGVQQDEQVVVLGGIIEQPGNKLFGYTGGEPTVVWNGLTLKLNPGQ